MDKEDKHDPRKGLEEAEENGSLLAIPEDDREEPEDGTGKQRNALPVDRGWAWVILFAATFEVFVFGGMLKSTGVFLVQYQKRFNSSASETFLISTVQNIVLSIMSLIVMTVLLNKISCRCCVIIGGLCTFASYLLTGFAEEFQILHISIGIIGGIGMSMTYLPILAMLGVYFDKYRGLANSITVSGSSIGGLVFAPVITTLFDTYGFTGTMMTVAAITLNIVISGALLRPMEFYSNREEKRAKKLLQEEGLDPGDMKVKEIKAISFSSVEGSLKGSLVHNGYSTSVIGDIDGPKISRFPSTTSSSSPPPHRTVLLNKQKPIRVMSYEPERIRNEPDFLRMQSHDPTRQEPTSPKSIRGRLWSAGHGRNRTISIMSANSSAASIVNSICRSKAALYSNTEFICGSLFDVRSTTSAAESRGSKDAELQEVDSLEARSETCSRKFCSQARRYFTTVFDCSLLSSSVFLWFLLMAACIQPGSILISVCIAPHAKDSGLTNAQIGGILSIIGCVDFFSRIAVGVISDKKWVKGTTIMATAAAVIGSLAHLIRFFNTFPTMVFFAVMTGMCCGVYMALYAVVLIEYLGLDRFKSSLGFTALFHGVAVAALFPLTGVLRDNTDSYTAPFHLLGSLLFLGAALAITLPLVHRWNESKKKATTTKPKVENNIIYKPAANK